MLVSFKSEVHVSCKIYVHYIYILHIYVYICICSYVHICAHVSCSPQDIHVLHICTTYIYICIYSLMHICVHISCGPPCVTCTIFVCDSWTSQDTCVLYTILCEDTQYLYVTLGPRKIHVYYIRCI